jgi:hypothetical protein
LILLFLAFLLQDSIALAREHSLYGVLGQGWAGVVVIMLLTLLYQNNIVANAVSYPFWFFSGHIVAARARSLRSQWAAGIQ